jgi:hypothetical protein
VLQPRLVDFTLETRTLERLSRRHGRRVRLARHTRAERLASSGPNRLRSRWSLASSLESRKHARCPRGVAIFRPLDTACHGIFVESVGVRDGDHGDCAGEVDVGSWLVHRGCARSCAGWCARDSRGVGVGRLGLVLFVEETHGRVGRFSVEYCWTVQVVSGRTRLLS